MAGRSDIQAGKAFVELYVKNSLLVKGLNEAKAQLQGLGKNIMAIGDAPNDMGMLQSAGIAVAMENAHPVLKKVAHWVAPSNDDHGVHAAMVKFGVCG